MAKAHEAVARKVAVLTAKGIAGVGMRAAEALAPFGLIARVAIFYLARIAAGRRVVDAQHRPLAIAPGRVRLSAYVAVIDIKAPAWRILLSEVRTPDKVRAAAFCVTRPHQQ